jgi:RNA polymerase sigma-70 factor, ECF subfamily
MDVPPPCRDGVAMSGGSPGAAVGSPGAADAELVARMAAGDEAALADAYDRHADAVYRSVLLRVGDRAAAEAVTQDVYVAAWREAGQHTLGPGGLLPWLLDLARARVIHAVGADGRAGVAGRRPRLVVVGGRNDPGQATLPERIETASRAATADGDGARPGGWAPGPSELAAARTALASLPEPDRRVLQLAYEEGLTQAEIAGRLGLAVAEVMARTRRALAALGTALGEVAGVADDSPGRPTDGRIPTDAPWPATRGRDAAR